MAGVNSSKSVRRTSVIAAVMEAIAGSTTTVGSVPWCLSRSKCLDDAMFYIQTSELSESRFIVADVEYVAGKMSTRKQ